MILIKFPNLQCSMGKKMFVLQKNYVFENYWNSLCVIYNLGMWWIRNNMQILKTEFPNNSFTVIQRNINEVGWYYLFGTCFTWGNSIKCKIVCVCVWFLKCLQCPSFLTPMVNRDVFKSIRSFNHNLINGFVFLTLMASKLFFFSPSLSLSRLGIKNEGYFSVLREIK